MCRHRRFSLSRIVTSSLSRCYPVPVGPAALIEAALRGLGTALADALMDDAQPLGDDQLLAAIASGIRPGPRNHAAIQIFRALRIRRGSPLTPLAALAGVLWALESPCFVADAPWSVLGDVLEISDPPGEHPPQIVLNDAEVLDDEEDIRACIAHTNAASRVLRLRL